VQELAVHDPEFSPFTELILEETVPAIVEAQRLGKVKSLGECEPGTNIEINGGVSFLLPQVLLAILWRP
jgi:hypothetical protein